MICIRCILENFTLTKAELIDALAEETELSKRQVGELVDLFLDEIRNALQKGDKVQLIPFGSFVVRDRKKREGRNPKTGAKLIIPARKVPAFTAGKGLRDAVGGSRKSAGKPAAKKKTSKKR
jgi:DNA-binding protein HU-beta